VSDRQDGDAPPGASSAFASPGPALRRARVEIDLGALERNFARLAARAAPARVLAVVKADAYGHGAVTVARALERAPGGGSRLAGFAVALAEEGIELRRGGVAAPVLVLSPVAAEAYAFLRRYGLVPVLSGLDQIEALGSYCRGAGWTLDVHLKFDTGMTRLGIPAEAAGDAFVRLAAGGLRLAGVMSHLAEAETPDSPANRFQQERFAAVLEALPAGVRPRVAVHLANSAAALHQPAARHDWVRAGLALYGLDPARARTPGALEPVLAVIAEIVQVKQIPEGTRVGYGGRWVAARPSRIAIVPVGYADGYSWRLGNRAEAILAGRRVPVVGAVSMDMLAVDATDAPAGPGDEVVLVGRRGAHEVQVADLAAAAGTLPYELLCLFGLRLPRFAVRSERREEAPRTAGAPGRAARV
jgi:alanine racemase